MQRARFVLCALGFATACGSSGNSTPDATIDSTPSPDAETLAVLPATYVVPIGHSMTFTAADASSWGVFEGPSGGTVDGEGRYTAPMTPGTYHVIAAAGTNSGRATVTVADFQLDVLTGQLGGPGLVDATGPTARIGLAGQLAGDGAGTIYFGDLYNGAIRKLDEQTGTVTTIAGSPGASAYADGTGSAASFNFPYGVAFDATAGLLYVADRSDHTIRQIVVATNEVTTIAGMARSQGSTNATGTAAQFYRPSEVALDGHGNLYVADTGNCTIRMIALASKAVTLVAGQVGVCVAADNATPTSAAFEQPTGLVVIGTTVWIADGEAIRRLDGSGVTTVAGQNGTSAYQDLTGTAARFGELDQITSDGAGNLYVADMDNNAIRKIVISSSVVSTFAGGALGSNDGQGTNAQFYGPIGLTYDSGALWTGDNFPRLRTIALGNAMVTTVAGTIDHSGDADGAFAAATLAAPNNLALDPAGTLYVSTQDDRIRALDLTNQVTSYIAGTYGRADGTGAGAQFYHPYGMALDSAGTTLFVADNVNTSIRSVTLPGGVVNTPFDNLNVTAGGFVNATGTGSAFQNPSDVVQVGNVLYVADTGNNAIRAIDLMTTETTTFAGGTQGSIDAKGTNAQFNNPVGLTTDGTYLYVSDVGNRTIRQIDLATAEVRTLAGQVGVAGVADGLGKNATFYHVNALAYDGAGSLYVAESDAQLIRRVYIPTGVVSTLAGVPFFGGVRLGSVSQAQLGTPTGVIVSSTKTYIAANGENAILVLTQQ